MTHLAWWVLRAKEMKAGMVRERKHWAKAWWKTVHRARASASRNRNTQWSRYVVRIYLQFLLCQTDGTFNTCAWAHFCERMMCLSLLFHLLHAGDELSAWHLLESPSSFLCCVHTKLPGKYCIAVFQEKGQPARQLYWIEAVFYVHESMGIGIKTTEPTDFSRFGIFVSGWSSSATAALDMDRIVY